MPFRELNRNIDGHKHNLFCGQAVRECPELLCNITKSYQFVWSLKSLNYMNKPSNSKFQRIKGNKLFELLIKGKLVFGKFFKFVMELT